MAYWLVIAYCGICWLGAALLGRPALASAGRFVQVTTIVSAPLLAPFVLLAATGCIWKGLRRSRTLLRHLRNFTEYDYTRLERGQLDSEIAAAFEPLTIELLERGFIVDGDYCLRTEPLLLIDRFCWDESGSIWASLCCCDGELNLEFASILKNGVNLSTVSLDSIGQEPEQEDGLILTCGGTLCVQTLLELHLKAVRNALQSQRTTILQFGRDQSTACVRYNHHLFYHWKHRQGECTLPPTPQLPPHRSEMWLEHFEARVAHRVLV